MLKDNPSENRKPKPLLKFSLIVLASTIFTVLLHQGRHDPLMTLSTKPRSVIITSGYFPVMAVVGLAIAFCVLGAVFLGIQKNLRGTRQFKGAFFGSALGGMYLVGMMEAYVVYPVSLFGEIYTGMVDGAGILLLSLLLGRYLAGDATEGKKPAYAALPAVVAIAVAYIVIRYFAYTVLHIESSFSTRPLATFLWTAGMGIWCGVMYALVGRGVWDTRPLKHAVAFGTLVFGINWLIFNLFALLFIQVPALDLLLRSLFDSIAVMIGIYISSFLPRKSVAILKV